MSTLRVAVQDYLEMRRSLGFKLHDAGIGLLKFVSFLEQQNASHITVALALQWAQESSSVQPVEWARRLSFVRGVARHWSATDPRTEVPPAGLLPYRPVRVRPYLYSEEEIQQLLQAALELESLQHGLLTYALVAEGLQKGLALAEPGQDWLSVEQWFEYAAERVVELHDESMARTRGAIARRIGGSFARKSYSGKRRS